MTQFINVLNIIQCTPYSPER